MQLDASVHERTLLTKAVEELKEQCVSLTGHGNRRQKIHHLHALKQEIAQLSGENKMLKDRILYLSYKKGEA